MSILDFVSQEDLDDLDEDPRIAFMTLVNLAQRSLSQQTANFDTRDEADWERREELRHSFMNVIVAAAKRFEIEPFVSMQVPTYKQFRNGIDHREFKADLDHFITQLMLDNSVRSKRDSVAILPASKDKIRAYVSGLRKSLEQAHMNDAKREVLLKKLDDFEAELEKRRLNILAVARLTFELLAIPGGLWASVEVANKLVHNIMQTVAEARSAEQETRQLPSVALPKALSPPRQEPFGKPPGASSTKEGGRMNDIIDDDIPF